MRDDRRAVQPHGVLLAVDESNLTVAVASQNATAMFDRDVLGRSLQELLAPADVARLRAGMAGDLGEINPLRVRVRGTEVDIVVHRVDGLMVTEWEPLPELELADPVWHRRLPSVLQRMSGAGTLEELTAAVASSTSKDDCAPPEPPKPSTINPEADALAFARVHDLAAATGWGNQPRRRPQARPTPGVAPHRASGADRARPRLDRVGNTASAAGISPDRRRCRTDRGRGLRSGAAKSGRLGANRTKPLLIP